MEWGWAYGRQRKMFPADPDQQDRKLQDLGEEKYCSRKYPVVITTLFDGIFIS